jgi:hypothetical protein
MEDTEALICVMSLMDDTEAVVYSYNMQCSVN